MAEFHSWQSLPFNLFYLFLRDFPYCARYENSYVMVMVMVVMIMMMMMIKLTGAHLEGLRKGCCHTRRLQGEGLPQGLRGRRWVAPGDPRVQGSWRCCLLGFSGVKFSSACLGGDLACGQLGRPSLSSVAGGGW